LKYVSGQGPPWLLTALRRLSGPRTKTKFTKWSVSLKSLRTVDLEQRFPDFSGLRPTCKYRGNLGTHLIKLKDVY